MSIPVIGSAIVNTPYWLYRCIMSVDYPTDEFVIFNNNGRDEITEELDSLKKLKHKYIKKITVCHLPKNVGCAAAMNLVIKCYNLAPYWIIVNPDVMFSPNLLNTMVEQSKDPDIGMVHAGPGDHKVGMFDLFLIKDWVVQRIGLFDENYYPGYVEDVDYLMRITNDPFKRVVDCGIPYYHGSTTVYGESGSQTWREDISLKEKIDYGRYINEYEYTDKKWGPTWRYVNPYKHPFNNDQLPNSYTTYDLEFIRRKNLGF